MSERRRGDGEEREPRTPPARGDASQQAAWLAGAQDTPEKEEATFTPAGSDKPIEGEYTPPPEVDKRAAAKHGTATTAVGQTQESAAAHPRPKVPHRTEGVVAPDQQSPVLADPHQLDSPQPEGFEPDYVPVIEDPHVRDMPQTPSGAEEDRTVMEAMYPGRGDAEYAGETPEAILAGITARIAENGRFAVKMVAWAKTMPTDGRYRPFVQLVEALRRSQEK